MTTLLASHALLPSGPARDVLIEVADGRFTSVTPNGTPSSTTPPPDVTRLRGVVLPGFANAHSHAFHRALRGRTHNGGGTFWTWREAMYALASRLDPDNYLALARAVYAEMALAGITTVGEFHYVHHAPGGRPYSDPNAMGHALQQAAGDAGIRLTLLDTCYLEGGLDASGHLPLDELQLRFSDKTVEAWASRVGDIGARPGTVTGAAIHSVRAVASGDLARAAAASAGRPLHVHLSEQPAENRSTQAYYGRTPTALLHENGALTPRTTVVHATHLSERDIRILGQARVTACFCPTTEQDLADGIGPARALASGWLRCNAAGSGRMSCWPPPRHTDRWAGRTPEPSRRACGLTWYAYAPTPSAPPARTPHRSCSPPPRPTSTRCGSTVRPSCPGALTVLAM
jgi:formiminoglutamate deiminase